MRYNVFVDTNILLSGIFFEGNESRILDLVEIDLITSADNVAELRKISLQKSHISKAFFHKFSSYMLLGRLSSL